MQAWLGTVDDAHSYGRVDDGCGWCGWVPDSRPLHQYAVERYGLTEGWELVQCQRCASFFWRNI